MTEAVTALEGDVPARQSVVVDGRKIAWREAGAGTPLVLLHGIGSGSASWRGQISAFADRYRVIAWDAPGYGESDPLPADDPRASDYARQRRWIA